MSASIEYLVSGVGKEIPRHMAKEIAKCVDADTDTVFSMGSDFYYKKLGKLFEKRVSAFLPFNYTLCEFTTKEQMGCLDKKLVKHLKKKCAKDINMMNEVNALYLLAFLMGLRYDGCERGVIVEPYEDCNRANLFTADVILDCTDNVPVKLIDYINSVGRELELNVELHRGENRALHVSSAFLSQFINAPYTPFESSTKKKKQSKDTKDAKEAKDSKEQSIKSDDKTLSKKRKSSKCEANAFDLSARAVDKEQGASIFNPQLIGFRIRSAMLDSNEQIAVLSDLITKFEEEWCDERSEHQE